MKRTYLSSEVFPLFVKEPVLLNDFLSDDFFPPSNDPDNDDFPKISKYQL